MKFRLPVILLFLKCIVSCVCVCASEYVADLIRDEDFIPFYAHIESEFVSSVGKLEVGERVVVIRPVDERSVLVEASRKGHFIIPVENTDLRREIEKARSTIADGEFTKMIPRMAFFLTGRLISGESKWSRRMPTEEVYDFNRWILLYGDGASQSARVALNAANAYYSSLSEVEREHIALVYMDVSGSNPIIRTLAEEIGPSFQCVPGYLSVGYTESFDHLSGDNLPQLVEVASSGRILARAEGADAVKDWLERESVEH